MHVSDVMTTNVVTIPSGTSIADAKRIMTAHKIERLPVVDNGKLVGIVSAHRLERVSPSQASNLTLWNIGFILEKTTVREIMERDMITVPPDMGVEEAVSLAQSKRVGSLVIVEDSKVVGIVTTNDFFYRIVNPILCVAKGGTPLPGTTVEITGGGEGKAMEEIISITNKLGLKLSTVHSMPPVGGTVTRDFCMHVESGDVGQLVSKLESKGYKVDLRRVY